MPLPLSATLTSDEERLKLRTCANAIRALSMDAVQKANSGHPGLPMGAADIATVLFSRFLKFDAADPHWPDRDRFVLSAGHGSMLLYSLLFLLGYKDMTLDQLKNFRQLGSKTAGHPEYGHAEGIETTTGPLGQGLANAVGMAIAERHLNARYGSDLVNHKTYVLAGDGCHMEGISQEAITLAGHLKLNHLIVLFDDNGISIDGKVSMADSTDQLTRYQASGWNVTRIDGHDADAIAAALEAAQKSDKPSLIACKTIIGYGAPNKQGTAATHGAPLGADEVALARKTLGWDHPPFDIPGDILDFWRAAGKRGRAEREAWEKRLAASSAKSEFNRTRAGTLPANFDEIVSGYKKELAKSPPALATRNSSQNALDVINAAVPETIGGSADLTGSNNTKSRDLKALNAADYGGRYVYYGIREHGMAAAMNGMALHGGVIPYGGTFLVFTDYCRPSIRLSALMGVRVIYVMTHDSIGLGEDGPTHQPVEHLAALRAIPNLHVFRPCDAVETAECWQLALQAAKTPSILALTRQKLRPARLTFSAKNLCAQGAYEIAASAKKSKAVIFASGSEIEIAIDAKALLDKAGIPTRVVSVPSMDLFEKQSKAYKDKVLGTEKIRIGIEAALRNNWDRFIGLDGIFIGMTGFGASGPIEKLYPHFGITAKHVLQAVKKKKR
ncbi:transketolase [Taklimakanibacter lacteus]|uniref:transketolase n=1 Tax=Taklimakanibacter lacteus TaxID=2268456 RepID=UPI000E66502F